MSISVPIPTSWKLPLFWATVDPSQAGGLTESQPALLVGQAFCVGAATASLKAGSVGNGTITLDPSDPVLAGAVLGTYKAVFISATAFNVFNPSGTVIGTGTVGSMYATQLKFLVAAGTTAFAVGSEFDILVTALSPGAAAYNKAIPIGSIAVAKQQFGAGSMIERMFNRFFAGNPTQQIWCLPVPEPVAGQSATGSIAFIASSLQSGVLTLYIAGQKLQIAVYSTDTAATIATKLAATINATATLPVTAVVDTTNLGAGRPRHAAGLAPPATTSLSCLNYGGLLAGEVLPIGLVATIAPMGGGQGEPDMTSAIGAIASQQFLHVGMPFNDTGSLDAWDAEYGFGAGWPLGLPPPACTAGSSTRFAFRLCRCLDLGARAQLLGHLDDGGRARDAVPDLGGGRRLLRAGRRGLARRSSGSPADAAACRHPAGIVRPAVLPDREQQPRQLWARRASRQRRRHTDDPARGPAVPAE